MPMDYGRGGIQGGAQGGGTNYGVFQARQATEYLNPSESQQYANTLNTYATGGLSNRLLKKTKQRLRAGASTRALNKAQYGFKKLAGAESDLGKLRTLAGERAMGAFNQQAMQLSKPWKYSAPEGVLTPETVTPYSALPIAPTPGATKGVRSRARKKLGGNPEESGIQGYISRLVGGGGTPPLGSITYGGVSPNDVVSQLTGGMANATQLGSIGTQQLVETAKKAKKNATTAGTSLLDMINSLHAQNFGG